MLSPETIEQYRRMTISERLALVMESCDKHCPALYEGPPEVVARRLELLRRENDLRNENLLAAFARLKELEKMEREKNNS